MSSLSARIPKLSAAKLELLTRRLREKSERAAYAPPIHRRDPSITRPPLSFAQQRLWFVQQLEPNNAAYNIPLSMRLSGSLNVAILERALSEVVRRHEVLRTTFEDVDGQPVQVISPPQPVNLRVIDLHGLSKEAQADKLAWEQRHEVETHFDLAAGPLWRAKLLRLEEEEHIALFTMHHAISDGWSMNVLTSELGKLYEAFSLNRPSPLEELPVQYADYAIWQREWLRGEVLDAQLNYWQRHLAGVPARLQLPSDRPQSRNRTTGGALFPFTVPPEVSEGLKKLGRREEATVFMLMLTAFALLLSRYSGQDDILIGTVIAGRQRLELERLIGFFINTLVMRVDLEGDKSFHSLLRRVRQTTLAAYANQDVPFEKLVSELQPGRDLNHSPLFQALLVVQNMPRSSINVEGLWIEGLETQMVVAKFDLTLVVAERDLGLAGTFVYSTDLFDALTIAGMADSLQQILRDAAGSQNSDAEAEATTCAGQTGELLNAFNAALE
jgi:pristinamycin I synthase 3 and 4